MPRYFLFFFFFASHVAEITGARHHTQLIFVSLVQAGFTMLAKLCLELLTSGDPPASASQSTGIIGVRHRAWPVILFYTPILLGKKALFHQNRTSCSSNSQTGKGEGKNPKKKSSKWFQHFPLKGMSHISPLIISENVVYIWLLLLLYNIILENTNSSIFRV